jgi:cytochrome c-type biogenesis protein CcmE
VSADTPLDLTPRHRGPVAPVTGRRWPAVVGIVAVVIALGFVLFNGLSNATVFFYNVDQAVAKRDEIGTSRVRLQGNVLANSIDRTANGVNFDLKYNGKVVKVTHTGEPPELFGPQIPIVLEGAFASSATGAVYRSDRMLIRHDSTYDEKNQKNVRDAERDAQNAP